MRNRPIVFPMLISLFVLTALGCGFLSGLTNDIGTVKGTVQAFSTDANALITQVNPLLSTGQAVITQEVPGLLDTVQAYATQNPGILDTVQAYVTQSGPGLLETLGALGTENPSLAQTGIAFATQHPDVVQTSQAIATQSAGQSPNAVPSDIPMPPQSEVSGLTVAQNVVSFQTSKDFKSIVTFFKTEMPKKGWKADKTTTVDTSTTSIQNYTQGSKKATIIITLNPADKKVSIVINTQ